MDLDTARQFWWAWVPLFVLFMWISVLTWLRQTDQRRAIEREEELRAEFAKRDQELHEAIVSLDERMRQFEEVMSTLKGMDAKLDELVGRK